MPVWVDLSEHEVSLNVYNSPNGKRLILRPLAPQSQIPPDITELGFEQRGGAYERRDLQFSLPQLRKYFPKAISREFAMSEIFFRLEEPSASDLIERYQWQRNRAGDQAFGNRQEVRTLTEAIFNEHVKPGLRSEYAETLLAYRAKQPSVTHCSLVQVAGTGEWRLDRIGTLEECRPSPENPAWVKKIDDFFSQESTDFGGIADDDARPRYQDGRTIPAEGNEVTDVRGGFGGSPVYLYGKVVSRRGSLRVQITGTLGLFNESASASTEPLSHGWTLKGEEHPYERQLRQARERDEQWKKEHAGQEADLRARADLSKAEGYPHLDMIDPPVGTRIENIDDGRTGTIIEYFELGDVLEPTVLFDDEPAGSGGVTIGGKQHRYRYRVIAEAPIDSVEEVTAIPESLPVNPVSIARTPWHVTRSTFIEESSFLPDGNGHGHVIFDNIQHYTDERSTKKAKDEVHARLVKDALYGRNADPLQPSLPTFEVMLDYPNLVYQLNQRAEKNVSRLLAQLGVSAKLLVGDNGYLKVENSPYMDLVIERLPDSGGDRLYLTHYFRSNGDSVMDAEMVFSIRKNGTLRLAETATQNPFRGGELRGRDVSFANMFSKNLVDQGFGTGKVLWPHEERAAIDAEEDDVVDIVQQATSVAITTQAVEAYVVEQINNELTRINHGPEARKVATEVESTDYAIEQILQAHPAVTNRHVDGEAYRQFVEVGKAVDNGRIRERVIGTREIPTFAEDAAAPQPAGYDTAKIGRQLASFGWNENTTGGFPYRKTVDGATYEISIGWRDESTKENRAWLTKLYVGPTRITEDVGSVEIADAEWSELRIVNELTKLLNFGGIDPTTPEGYAKVMADEALQLKFQDTLDAFFAGRIIAVRKALRELGWENGDAPLILKKSDGDINASATIDTKNVGAGANVVEIIGTVFGPQSGQLKRFPDDLTKTPAELAGQLDAAAFHLDLEAAPLDISPVDLYAAELSAYWEKQGKEFHPELALQRAKDFFETIATRDAKELISRLAPSQSPISRRWFEKVTGISLGRTSKETKEAVIAWAGNQQTTLPPTDAPELPVVGAPAADTNIPAATGVAKVNVYGESDGIAAARNEVIAIALREYFTEKGAREYADEASRGDLSASQRELGTSELVAAADRLYRACQENASLAKNFAETLNAELAAEEHQAATDFAFHVRGFSDGLSLVAHNQNLEVRSPNHGGGAGYVVQIVRLEAGQYKAHHGSAESRPATLLAAVRWASNLLDELLATDLKVQEGLRREIKVYVDGFRQFLPAGQPLDREALMESIQLFTSDDAKTTMVHMPKFLGSGTIRHFSLPDDAILEFVGENALRISAAGHTCEIQATEPAPEFDEELPWIRRNHERNAPMSFVGALSSASSWLKENQAWESKKASYPDEGLQVEALAHQYAASLHESMPTHHDGSVREMHRSFAIAIMDKHVDYLMGWIARGRGQNDLSKKFFAKATGCKMPSTIRDITATLYAWAGFTPEQAATREAEKEAAHEVRLQARRMDDDIRWCGDALSNSRVNHEGEIKTTKQFMDEILDKGYTHIGKRQSGAAVRYTLENPEIKRSYNIKGKMVDYARAVLAKREEQEKAAHLVQEVREEEPQSVLRP